MERSDIIPLNLIDSIWRRFPERKLPTPLRPSVKDTLCYSQILYLFLIPLLMHRNRWRFCWKIHHCSTTSGNRGSQEFGGLWSPVLILAQKQEITARARRV